MAQNTSPSEFAGKRILVSGGTRGIGKAIVERFIAGDSAFSLRRAKARFVLTLWQFRCQRTISRAASGCLTRASNAGICSSRSGVKALESPTMTARKGDARRAAGRDEIRSLQL
jgi:NAD(P)-dependent dehydrogenase (short-subunit alcohol dehydrogenase family)